MPDGTAAQRGIAGSRRVPAAELWYALAGIAAATGLYAFASTQAGAFPSASGLVGHGIGIVGFVLMLMTGTLYSLRKLSSQARWGSVAGWLRFHMVTGLVGPYLVLLHTALRFHGLAALAMVLTVVVAASGLVGRYLYTRVPRELDEDSEADEAEQERRRLRLVRRRRAFALWHTLHVPIAWALFVAAFMHVFAALFYATLSR